MSGGDGPRINSAIRVVLRVELAHEFDVWCIFSMFISLYPATGATKRNDCAITFTWRENHVD